MTTIARNKTTLISVSFAITELQWNISLKHPQKHLMFILNFSKIGYELPFLGKVFLNLPNYNYFKSSI
jgi:hypothetical protein